MRSSVSAPGAFAAWWLAARPKTLTVSVTPVIVGSAVAFAETGLVAWLPLLVALVAAMLIQIGTNLHNDAGDFERGTDTPDRLGPPRASAMGWLPAASVRRGAWIAFALAFALGAYLVARGGWPIVAVGLASLAAGWAYTGGSRPIAYSPLGEVFVFVFFGLVAVGGSYYLQTFGLSLSALVVGAAVGSLAAAVITVNNYRDLDGDARAGKRTLAVHLGRPAIRVVYGLQVLAPFALLLPLALLAGSAAVALPLLALPWAVGLLRRFRSETPGPAFNDLLARTAQLQFVFGGLLAAGLLA